MSNEEDNQRTDGEVGEVSATESDTIETDFIDVAKMLPKVDADELKKDVFKNFDKIESEFDTLD